MSTLTKVRIILSKVNVEPTFFLYSIHVGAVVSGLQAFFIFKSCLHIFDGSVNPSKHNETILRYCSTISRPSANGTTTHADIDTEKFSSTFSQIQSIVITVPSVVAALYFGQISDKYGRKPALIFSLSGGCLSFLVYTVSAALANSSIYIILFGSFIAGVSGVVMVVSQASFAMMCDASESPSQMTIRLGIGSMCLYSGIVIGSLSAGNVAQFGYQYVMLVGAIAMLLALIYAIFFVVETRPSANGAQPALIESENSDAAVVDESDAAYVEAWCPLVFKSFGFFLRETCDYRRYKELFATISKSRPNYNRAYLIVALVNVVIFKMANVGAPAVLYLKRTPLSFSNRMLGYFTAYTSACGAIGAIVISLIFKKLFKTTDLTIVVFSGVFLALYSFLFSVSTSLKMVFISGSLTTFAYAQHPAIRAFMAKLVEPDEIGKLFGFVAMLENVAPLVASIIYNNLYAFSLNGGLFPGFVFMIGGIVSLMIVISVGWMSLHAKYRGFMPDDERPITDAVDNEHLNE